MPDKKSTFKKIWYFIWEDDSILSWIVNVVLAFVLIKFIVYPGLGFLLGGTSHPVVAVVSGSMEHAYAPKVDYFGNPVTVDDSKLIYAFCSESFTKKRALINFKDFKGFDSFWEICGDWYENSGISKQDFSNYDFKNGFNTGDIIFLRGKSPEDIEVGEVIVFMGNRPDPIIHRVVKKENKNDKIYFQTKGDHNPTKDPYKTSQEKVIGKAFFRVPWLGYIKIWFVEFLRMLGIYKYIPI
ncbi:signal peptidase I [Candidatus Woesearchaeota archaeon]|nr:signal peptidase I [Candidatus Woesearchaeota archaeon]